MFFKVPEPKEKPKKDIKAKAAVKKVVVALPQMARQSGHRFYKTLSFIRRHWLITTILVLIAWQPVSDWWIVHSISPNSTAAIYAQEVTMTNHAKLTFYKTHPELEAKASFDSHCPDASTTPELGCYVPQGNKIYILSVDRSFASEMTVTAAHEMLHSVYEHLGEAERHKVDGMLEAQVKKIADPELTRRLALYAKLEPGARDNELHSILGTEFGDLDPELESYYSQYFVSRSTVVAANQKFEADLAEAKNEIDRLYNQAIADKTELEQIDANMEYLRQIGSIYAYNSLVPRQNQLVSQFNAEVDNYNVKLATFNSSVISLDSSNLSPINSNIPRKR